MRLIASLAALLLIATLHLNSYASGPEVVLKNNVFFAPTTGLYVESDMMVLANTLSYKLNERGKYNASVNVYLLFKLGKKIIQFDKYNLNSADIDDTTKSLAAIIDKRRYSLRPGIYTVEATFTDLNNQELKHMTQTLVMEFDSSKTNLSDISLVDSYVKVNDDGTSAADGTPMKKDYIKSGLYMTPMVHNFYPEQIHKIRFYAEAYPAIGRNDTMLAVYSIRKYNTIEPVNNLGFSKRIAPKAVIPLFGEFDISGLSTGNYDVVMEIRDKQNNLIVERKAFFQRSKSEGMSAEDLSRIQAEGTFVGQLDMNTMKYQMKTVRPIATQTEAYRITELLKTRDLPTIQKFFLAFWMTRDAKDPYGAWVKYEDKVKQVNQQFGTTVNYGFETDRGRVYLIYGPPNQLSDMPHEPSAYPYQIWQYYKLGKQTNVKFVFYNQDLATNEYELIHSNAYGEIRNEQWQRLVYAGKGVVDPADQGTDVNDHFGSKASERFGNP